MPQVNWEDYFDRDQGIMDWEGFTRAGGSMDMVPQNIRDSFGQGGGAYGGGYNVQTGTGGGLMGGPGGGEMLSPADWQKEYISGGLDYLKENRDILMGRMDPHYASVEHLARTGQDVGTEEMITRGTEQMSRDIRSRAGAQGVSGSNFANAAEAMSERAGIGETAASRSRFRQWGSEQQGNLDRTLAGFLGNTAGAYAGLSGRAAGMRNPALEQFGIQMGAQPWQSEVSSMSGGRNPFPEDFYSFQQSY